MLFALGATKDFLLAGQSDGPDSSAQLRWASNDTTEFTKLPEVRFFDGPPNGEERPKRRWSILGMFDLPQLLTLEPTSPTDRKHDCYMGVPRRIGGQLERCAQIAAKCGLDDSPATSPHPLGGREKRLGSGSGESPLRKRAGQSFAIAAAMKAVTPNAPIISESVSRASRIPAHDRTRISFGLTTDPQA